MEGKEKQNIHRKAKFIMVEGIDGTGKGYIVDTIVNLLMKKGLTVYDLRKKEGELSYLPLFEELCEFEVFVYKEPPDFGIGKDLRLEILRRGKEEYNARTHAYAFSVSREVLYKRLVIPALKNLKLVVAERGFISSIVYQPLFSQFLKDDEILSPDFVLSLEGNKIAIQNPPNLVLVADCDVNTALDRITERDRDNKSLFETREMLEKSREIYLGKQKFKIWGKEQTLEQFLAEIGKNEDLQYVIVNANDSKDVVRERVEKIISDFFLKN